MPQFDTGFFYSQIFWLAIFFTILYLIIAKFVVPTSDSIANKRKHTIYENISDAEALSEKVKTLKAKHDLALQEINLAVNQIKQQAQAEANRQFELESQELEHNSKIVLNKNSEDLLVQAKEFRNDAQKQVNEISSYIIERITGEKPSLDELRPESII